MSINGRIAINATVVGVNIGMIVGHTNAQGRWCVGLPLLFIVLSSIAIGALLEETLGANRTKREPIRGRDE